MKVLVVDDEADVQALFQQRFRKELRGGVISFHFALSAEEALKFLSTHEGAVLILSDINMPGMNGLDLLRLVKEQYPHLKVFMVTAYGDEEYHRRAIALGCDDYLTKPIDFSLLREKLLEPGSSQASKSAI
jgi:two-component system chemotaxis response regulator CheY